MTAPEDRKLLIPDRWWDKLPRPAYSTLERVPSSQPWFKAYKVLESVYTIHEANQHEEALSTLILDDEAVVDIAEGRGEYLEGTDMGIPIRKYDYGRFSVVTRADQTGP